MDLFTFGPVAAVLGGAYALVTALGGLLAPVFGTAAAAAAVVALTMLVRAALIPVGLSRALSCLSFITVVFAAFVPLAAALYLLTTTTWTLVERIILRRALGGPAMPAR